MKVLMVNKFLYPRGGAETYLLQIGAHLAKQGHEVEYFGMYDKKNTVSNALGVSTTNMDFHALGWQRLRYPFQILYSHEAKGKLQQVIRKFAPHIIHFHNINFQLTPAVIDGAYACKVPLVQTVHDLQMLCPNHLMYSVREKRVCEKCLQGSKLHCVRGRCIHGSLVKSMLGTMEAWLYKIKKSYTKINRFICPSGFLEQKLLTDHRFYGKTVVKHNFIAADPLEESHCKPQALTPGGEPYVLYFGRLAEEKGIQVLLKACRLLPQIPVVVAGDGPLLPQVRTATSNVRYVGFQTGKKLQQLIQQACFTVCPSVCYENCPLSVLESEAMGTPVLCSDRGGFPELVEDGVNGCILPGELTAQRLAEKIQWLYNQPDLLADMSTYCLQKKQDRLTAAQYCDWLLDLYQETIAAHQSS